MIPISLIAVGGLKSAWLQSGCAEYIKRLQAFCTLKIIEVPASKATIGEKQQQEESEKLREKLKKTKGRIFLLDEGGDPLSSAAFAQLIGQAQDVGSPLTFVIGGAYGLEPELKTSFPTLSLGRITLPHELCRVVFLEQLYRACSLHAGRGYHH